MTVPNATLERMITLRRDLHAHPELSLDEERTAQQISGALAALGIDHQTGVGGYGIVADIGSGTKTIALRGDMDALPVHEETGLPFASTRPGVMHACGHDGHTAMLVGAAELLLANPPSCRVRLLWQPAEERAAGAKAMIEDGVLDGVTAIFAGHVDRHHVPGTLVVTDGCVNASSDSFTIDIRGRGGHGARPHEALDAVVVGSLLVTALQTIVSREVDPADPSVVTIGMFQAGSASNVIAGSAHLEGTIRAQTPRTRSHLQASIRRIAESIGHLHGADVSMEMRTGTPPLHNTPEMASIARAAAQKVVGPDKVEVLRTANMGGEDFAYFLEHVPGAYIRYGAQVAGRESHPAHSPHFDFDETALSTGAAWLAQVAHEACATL